MPDENGNLTHKELEERWDREEGKLFKKEIIRQLQSDEHCVDWVNLKVTTNEGKEYHWKDFPGVMEIRNESGKMIEIIPESLLNEEEEGKARENAKWGDLRFVPLRKVKLSNAFLSFVCLENADLLWASLENANLYSASLKNAFLFQARLENAHLHDTRLENADLNQAKMQGAYLSDTHFRLKSFCWRTGLIMICQKLGIDISRFRPTLLEGAELKNVRLDSDPVMYRELLDEQYLDRMAEKHPKFYKFWLLTSNCGRSVWLLIAWSLFLALCFGLIYADLSSPSWFPGWLQRFLARIDPKFEGFDLKARFWDPIYMSFVTMTTLGWSGVKPDNQAGYWWHTAQNLFGYIWLGYLVSVLGSKLTRRSA